MNRIYIVVLLLLFSMQLRSQILISTPYNGNQTYDMAAPEYVRILPGFQYVPQGANYFRAYIDPSIILPFDYVDFPVDCETRLLDDNLPFGTTPGQASVSLTGGASYSIPIFTPPGTAAIQPAVSLVYSSQEGNGIAGYGWNIAGLSTITRVSNNIYFDGVSKPVQLNTEDRFALDGQRMVVFANQSYGANGTEYSLENFNGVKIKLNFEDNYTWFLVETNDNHYLEYGRTTDSRIKDINSNAVISWNLNRIYDQYGNYMVFKYLSNCTLEGATNQRIAEINYTGSSNSLPYNKIKFVYSERSDKTESYFLGNKFSSEVLLKKVMVIAENQSVKEYTFDYYLDDYSYLGRVTETGSDGTNHNYTQFCYGECSANSTANLLSPSTNIAEDYPGPDVQYKYEYSDYNGDGLADILQIAYTQNIVDVIQRVRLYINTTSFSTYNEVPVYTLKMDSDNGDFDLEKCYMIKFGDLNGDGRSDILQCDWTGTLGGGYGEIYAYFSKPEMYNTEKTYLGDLSGIIVNIEIIEMNGDGLGDILFYSIPYTTSTAIKPTVRLSSPSTNNFYYVIYSNSLNIGSLTASAKDQIQFGDLNGDNRTDIAINDISNRTLHFYKYNNDNSFTEFFNPIVTNNPIYKFYFGDFNGDGNSDIFYITNWVEWYLSYKFNHLDPAKIELSDGKQMITIDIPINGELIINDVNESVYHVNDFNSDGKTDIVQIKEYNSAKSFSLYYLPGNTFKTKEIASLPIQDWADQQDKYNITDFNGDGQPDIVSYYTNATSHFNYLSIFPNNQRSFLHMVSNGIGMKNHFFYKPLTNPSIYTISNPQEYITNTFGQVFGVTIPMKGVSDLFETFRSVTHKHTTYKYEQFFMHRNGKGLLGLKSFTETNALTAYSVKSSGSLYFDISHNNFCTFLSNESMQKLGNTLKTKSSMSQKVKLIKLGATQSNRAFVAYPHTIITEDYVSDLKTKTTILPTDVDDYGNIKTVTRYYADDNESYDNNWDKTESSYISAHNWYPCNPELVTTSKKRDNDVKTYITTSKSVYYPSCTEDCPHAGRLYSTTEFFGTEKSVTKSYDYDLFGLTKSVALTSTDPLVESRSTSFTTDIRGRFILSNTNPLGYTASKTVNAIGLTTTETDMNGLTFTYDYDGFGSLKTTTLPDGIQTNTTTRLHTSSDPMYTCFVKEIETPGFPSKVEYYDVLNQIIKTCVEGFNGKIINQIIAYNYQSGKIDKTSPPYFSTDPEPDENDWVRYAFYDDGRLKFIIKPEYYEEYYYLSGRNNKTERFFYDGSSTSIFKSTKRNFLGQVDQVTDLGGSVSYTYYGSGLPKSVTGVDEKITTTEYDDYYRQKKLIDPDAGEIIYNYDAFGDLRYQKDANGIEYNMDYDKLGRIKYKSTSKGTVVDYVYDAVGKPKGSVSTIAQSNGVSVEYSYDGFSRIASETQIIDGKSFTSSFTYDPITGNLATQTYPSGFVLKNTYLNGYLTKVYKNADASPLVDLAVSGNYDAWGNLTQYALNNGLIINKSFDQYGKSTGVKYGNVMELSWEFDGVLGNLNWRKDITNPAATLIENFTYNDNLLNRLNNYQVDGQQNLNVSFNSNGSINSKTDAGVYLYEDPKHAHAVSTLTSPVTIPSDKLQSIEYNDYGKISHIAHSTDGVTGYSLNFKYGPDMERKKTQLYFNGALLKTNYYTGFGYEEEVLPDGTIRKLNYVPGPDGLLGIYLIKCSSQGTTLEEKMYYIHTDHLDSWKCITNENGQVVEKMDFDPWGRRRNPTDWTYNNVPATYHFDRGYTGHEMMDAFGLINMNGRVYDPVIARFLSPDNYVQSTTSSQGFDRYGYCANNPLIYTDPSGNIHSPLGLFMLVGFSIGNLIDQEPHPFDKALKDANFGESICSQSYPLYTSNNFTVSGGINIYTIGAFIDVNYHEGNFSATASGGYGLLSGGPFLGSNATYSSNGSSLSIGGGYSFGGFKGSDFSGWYLGGGGSVKLPGDAGNLNLYVTKYYSKKPNIVWQLGYSHRDFSVNLNEDFGFSDKHRTGGADFGIGDFHFGALVYTNDPENDLDNDNLKGQTTNKNDAALAVGKHYSFSKLSTWTNGRVYFAPAYIGFSDGNRITRVGYSSKYVQTILQNGIHKLFNSQNYYSNYDDLKLNTRLYFTNDFNNIFSIYQ